MYIFSLPNVVNGTVIRKNSIDIEALGEFCEREGKEVTYRKGDQLEREGDPARWFGFVTEGCFKYVTYGISDDREHITWFSFEGEFAGDYPACLDGRSSQTTIKAMMPSRMLRVSGEQLMDFFRQDAEKMELRSVIAEHLLCQANIKKNAMQWETFTKYLDSKSKLKK